MIAVKAAPGSWPGISSSPATRTWALEETGRNSVRAWTRPRMTASMKDTDSPREDGRGQRRTDDGTEPADHGTRTQYAAPGAGPGAAWGVVVKRRCGAGPGPPVGAGAPGVR